LPARPDRALHREKESAISEFKERAARIRHVEDIDNLWSLEDWLQKRRKMIDDKFDYRYSVLAHVLAQVISEGAISEADRAGLGDEKLAEIRRVVGFHRSHAEEAK